MCGKDEIREALEQRVLLIDGAMGTMVQRLGLSEADYRGDMFAGHPVNLHGCIDVLNLSCPEAIEAIHTAYLEAGADIIETNTFSSQPVSMAEYGLEEYAGRIAYTGVAIAVEAAKKYMETHPGSRKWVAATMGPTGKSLSMSATAGDEKRSVDWVTLENAFYDQASAFIAAGADMILIETVFDSLNAKAAGLAVRRAMDDAGRELPVMVSFTLTRQGRTLSGQTLEAAIASMSHLNPLSVGLNCGFGASQLIPYIKEIQSVPYAISFHPNAGHPDELGEYREQPHTMAAALREVLKAGMVNIVGGCCGTTPAHIAALAEEIKTAVPRKIPAGTGVLVLSGLDAVPVPATGNPLVRIGERCNVAGSRKFLRLVKEGALDEAVEIARSQIKAGATVIDVNVDDAMLDDPAEMVKFLNRLASDAEIASVPVMIDSSSWDTIVMGLRQLQGRGIVNSISLKDGEDEFIRRAKHILRMGAAVVVMAMDEKGQADTYERKIEIIRRADDILINKVGFQREAVIYDPNVLAVATGIEEHNSYGLAFIEASKWIKREIPGSHVSGGISNLSFSFRGNDQVRKAMHAEFISLATGLDMAIVNPSADLNPEHYPQRLRQAVRAVLMNESAEAPRQLEEMAAEIQTALAKEKTDKKQPESAVRKQPVNTAAELAEMIVSGRTEGMSALLEREIASGKKAMQIVDDSLMNGMDRVGELFGQGRMFLPQVVRSANAMKHAVEWLTPYISAADTDGVSGKRPKAIIATVKGDVHDIGKNIVAIILRCNGFDVEDLGVMVPCEQILSRAETTGADMVCLSGLITPSLHEMAVVAGEMERRGMKLPLFVGGAATTPLHTAARIATEYSGPVFHTFDAATLPVVARSWLSADTRGKVEDTNREAQARLRETLCAPDRLVPFSEANARAIPHPAKLSSIAETVAKGVTEFTFKIEEVSSLINWRPFFTAWKLDASFASLAAIDGCDHCRAQWLASVPEEKRCKAAEAMQLHKEALRMLDRVKAELKNEPIRARVVICEAAARGNDIVMHHDGAEIVIPTLRSQTPAADESRLPAMADYVMENASGYPDRVGLFAVTVGVGMARFIEALREEGNEYEALLCQSLADRLAEAATELMHCRMTGGEGLRPAIGYQSLPDQSLVFEADKALKYSDIDIQLTDSGAMWPQGSTTGMLILNPVARYFTVGSITKDQAEDYSRRRGSNLTEMQPFIGVRVAE